jgi:hypothetical protein
MKRRKGMNQNQESKVVEVEEKELKEVPKEQNESNESSADESKPDEKPVEGEKKSKKKKFIVGGIIAAATAVIAAVTAVILHKDEPEEDDLADIGDYPDRKKIEQKDSAFEKISDQLSTIIDRLPIPGDDSPIE